MRFRFQFIFICLSIFYGFNAFSQGSIAFKVTRLKPGDSCTVFVNKNAEEFDYKKIGSNKDSLATHTFSGLSNGKWSVKIDATGYYYPTSKVVELNNNSILVEISLTPITLANSVNYVYEWKDDSSYLGHAQQSYINDPVSIVVIDDTIRIADNTASVNLFNKYGITLSDKISAWTAEDAFRLYQSIENVPLFQTFGEGNKVKVTSLWKITNDEVIDDISITTSGDIKLVTVSRKAFVYANPSVVLVDGVRGKYFSKRLHHAVVAFATNYGLDKDAIGRLAKERYGFSFLVPGPELSTLMKEDASNFQEFSAFEKLTIISMIEELPDGMRIQPNLKYLVRRIAGQVNPKKPEAAAIAWIGMNTIEFMNSAFQGNSYFDIQRLVLHEKGHFLWAGLFDDKLKEDWTLLGGWFLDPTSPSGWSTSNTTEFVSAYAHLKDPNEDMAESIAFYVLNPDKLRSRSLKKFEFIRDRIMNGTRYVAMIRKDLTFTVYNLFPDYNYPGKIKRVNVKAEGLPNEDKKVTLEIELNIIDSTKDGATSAYARFASSAGTIFDIGLSPVNAIGSILRGTVTISKFVKSGYWTVNQISVYDPAGNMRLENNSTYGLKLFTDNPKEDLLPPVYKDPSLKLSKGTSKFSSMGPFEDPTGMSVQYVEAKFDIIEKNALTYVGANFAIPKVDEKGVKTELQLGVLNPKGIDTTKYDYYRIDTKDSTIKYVKYRYPVPDYFPKGYYELTMLALVDEGENWKRSFFMKDTSKFTIGRFDSLKVSKHLRDSIYIETPYPDYIPPVLDVNAITIRATPTRPEAPDGETLFEMEFFAKDSSAYSGKEAGLKHGSYILRDPQGKQFSYSMQGDFNKVKGNFYYLITDPSGNPGIWRKYKVSTLLPRGSAPGLWGVESIDLYDRANNVKHYNFVELVRFDIEKENEGKAVNPKVEILNKKVNARNVDSINMAISCASCKDKIFRARIYSDMGGNSIVYEGTMASDSITIKNIKLTGVNDGVLYATVFVMDTTRKLLGIGKSSYTKDVIAPRSSILKTNLSNFGKSNIDSFILDMRVLELKGEYNVVLKQSTVTPSGAKNGSEEFSQTAFGVNKTSGVGDSVVIKGNMTDTIMLLKNLPIKDFSDGLIEVNAIFIDSVGNESKVTKTLIFKDTKDPVVSISRSLANGLSTTLSVSVNEFVSNTFSSSHLNISNGTVRSIEKVDSRNFKLVIDRSCSDTLGVELKEGALLDTVGNKNAFISFRLVDTIIPAKPIVAAVNYCLGSSAVPLTATPATGAVINWYGTVATGGTATNIAPIPVTSVVGSTDYFLSQTNTSTKCEGQRTKLTVNVYAIPVKAEITKDPNANLVSNSTSGNQWYKDGQVITGATSPSYKPNENGYYSVKVTQNGCTSLFSEAYYYLTTALVDLGSGNFIKFFPNPVKDHITIAYSLSEISEPSLLLMNIQGQIILSVPKIKHGQQIWLSNLPKGNYTIKIQARNGKNLYLSKLVKL